MDRFIELALWVAGGLGLGAFVVSLASWARSAGYREGYRDGGVDALAEARAEDLRRSAR